MVAAPSLLVSVPKDKGRKSPGFSTGTTVKPHFLHPVLVQLIKEIKSNLTAGLSETGKCYTAGLRMDEDATGQGAQLAKGLA